jgi:transcriptional regulator, ArsR family
MEALSPLLKALADPVRLAMLDFLLNPIENCLTQAEGVCACDFEAGLGMTQPTVSHHMKVLVQAGLVHAQKHGRWVRYSVNPAAFASVCDTLRPFTEAPPLPDAAPRLVAAGGRRG